MVTTNITVQCSECGADIHKVAYKNNRSDADIWELWESNQRELCASCWSKEKRAEEVVNGLVLDAEIIVKVATIMYDKDSIIRLSFLGDTMPHKEAIKELGYQWVEFMSAEFVSSVSTSRPQKVWQKSVTPAELDAEVKKAEAIGATIRKMPTQEQAAMVLRINQIIVDNKVENENAPEADLALLVKPVPPSIPR